MSAHVKSVDGTPIAIATSDTVEFEFRGKKVRASVVNAGEGSFEPSDWGLAFLSAMGVPLSSKGARGTFVIAYSHHAALKGRSWRMTGAMIAVPGKTKNPIKIPLLVVRDLARSRHIARVLFPGKEKATGCLMLFWTDCR